MDRKEFYDILFKQCFAITEDEADLIANLANVSSVIYEVLDDVNWVGFYLMKQGELVLGPFQGKAACVRIPVGKGVCGTAVSEKRTQVVRDVHEFPGHIACDGSTNSEIVVPMIKEDEVIGVLDIDSQLIGRFDETDAQGLKKISDIMIK